MTTGELIKLIGSKVRVARMEAGLSQRELAKKANIYRTHISIIEIGSKGARIATLKAIADALDKDVKDFL